MPSIICSSVSDSVTQNLELTAEGRTGTGVQSTSASSALEEFLQMVRRERHRRQPTPSDPASPRSSRTLVSPPICSTLLADAHERSSSPLTMSAASQGRGRCRNWPKETRVCSEKSLGDCRDNRHRVFHQMTGASRGCSTGTLDRPVFDNRAHSTVCKYSGHFDTPMARHPSVDVKSQNIFHGSTF